MTCRGITLILNVEKSGMFDTWTNPAGDKLHTCTIITTKPNDVVADIHDHMPVILRQEDEAI